MRFLFQPLGRFFLRRWIVPRWRETRYVAIFNAIAVLSVAVGTLAVLLAVAILHGFESAIYRYVTSFMAHIEITGLFNMPIDHYEDAALFINQTSNVAASSPYRSGNALLKPKSSNHFEGVFCKGVPPNAKLPYIFPFVKSGLHHFTSDSAAELFVGTLLAERLQLQVGDTVFALAFAPQFARRRLAANVERLIVAGIFETGATQFDENVVFLPFGTAGKLFGFSRYQATGFDVYVANIDQIVQTAEQLNQGLGYRFVARTMYDRYSSLFAWIDLQKRPIPIVLGLIAVVALFNVVSALLTLMVAKMQEIALLRSLGMRRQQLRQVFLAVGMTLVLSGWLLGSVLTLLVSWIQQRFHVLRLQTDVHFFSYLPIELSSWHFITVAAILLPVGFLTIWIPATMAMRIPPLRAFRFR